MFLFKEGGSFMARQKKTTVCPLGGDGVGGKWKFWILYHLLAGTKRFGALQRLLPGVSRQMLTIQLRELEQMGLLTRLVYPQALPKVEYSLTELGWSLEPLLHQMEKWGKWYGEQIGPQYDWIVSLGGRWKFWIWYHLLSGPKRFSEVQRLLPQASRQMLAIQLRELEQMGVLHHQTEAPGSPKGAYQLSELGQRSEPMLHQMYLWGRWCCEQVGLEYDWNVGDCAEQNARTALQSGVVTFFNSNGGESPSS
jgi:DNA-binding HxlR family transcriptional regulator